MPGGELAGHQAAPVLYRICEIVFPELPLKPMRSVHCCMAATGQPSVHTVALGCIDRASSGPGTDCRPKPGQ